MMAAGVPPVAHNSGGSAIDIVGSSGRLGLLATTEIEYSQALESLLLEPGAKRRRAAMAAAARESVRERFSEEAFAESFCAELAPALAG